MSSLFGMNIVVHNGPLSNSYHARVLPLKGPRRKCGPAVWRVMTTRPKRGVCYQTGNTLYVSPDVYEKLKQLPR